MFLNPNFDQLKELVKERPETLRIIITKDEQFLGIANGHNYIHSSIARKFPEVREGDCYIFQTTTQKLWWIDDLSEMLAQPVRYWPKTLKRMLDDLIQLMGEE
jgi:hypothetical protein